MKLYSTNYGPTPFQEYNAVVLIVCSIVLILLLILGIHYINHDKHY
jgi:hypothetical protein